MSQKTKENVNGLNFNKYLQSKWKTQIVSTERRSGSKDLSFNPVRQQEDS